MGNIKDDGTGVDALTSGNNTCKNATLQMCSNERLGTGKKHYCQIAAVKGCYANCDSCVDASDTTNNRLKVEAAGGGTCAQHTQASCFALTATQHFCPNDKSCAASCSNCTGKFAPGNLADHGNPGGNDGLTGALSNSNNECKPVRPPMCYFERMGTGLLQFCPTDVSCKANCLSCANKTILGRFAQDGTDLAGRGSYANGKFPAIPTFDIAHTGSTPPYEDNGNNQVVFAAGNTAKVAVNDVFVATQGGGTLGFQPGPSPFIGFIESISSNNIKFKATYTGSAMNIANADQAIGFVSYPIIGNVCQAASPDLCWADKQETGNKNFCSTTGGVVKCVATDTATTTGCSACIDKNASQRWNDDGSATPEATSGNNSCKAVTAAMCTNEKLGAGKKDYCPTTSDSQSAGGTGKGCYADCLGCGHSTPGNSLFKKAHATNGGQCAPNDQASCFAETTNKHFCDVDKSCHANCDMCPGKSAPGIFNNNGTTADETLSATTNLCKAATAAMCFNSKFPGKPEFCPGVARCQANCDGAEPVSATGSPAGTTAPGIFAALAAAVAFALRM